MDKLVIQGGPRLRGTVTIGGSKNACLPIMAAAILADGPVTLHEVPVLADIRALTELLARPDPCLSSPTSSVQ